MYEFLYYVIREERAMFTWYCN